MAPTATQVHPQGSVSTGSRRTQVFRFLILGGLVFWIAVGFWPRGTGAHLDDLLTDLQAREVTELQIDREDAWHGLFVGPWRDRGDEMRVRWRTEPDGRWYTFLTHEQPEYIDPPALSPPAEAGRAPSLVLHDGRDPVLNRIAAELADLPDHGASLGTTDAGWRVASSRAHFGNIWLIATWLAVMGTLVSGPQPRRATKWAWFWILNAPYGVGFVLLLLLDAPWARSVSRQPEPLPHDQQVKAPGGDGRLTGGWMFLLVMLVGGFG